MSKAHTIVIDETEIDILSVVLPNNVYVKWIAEGKHPHEPLAAALQRAMKIMTLEDKKHMLKRVKEVKVSLELVEKTIAK